MSCFDGMVVDNDNDDPNAKPAPLSAYTPRLMPPPTRASFDMFPALYPDSGFRRLSIAMNGMAGGPNTDSLSRSKGGELPVLEHLLSADGARTLSLGESIFQRAHVSLV
jgi:hypothetical protein